MVQIGIAKEMYRCCFTVSVDTDGRKTFVRSGLSVRYPNGSRLWRYLLFIERRKKSVSKAKKASAGKSAFAKEHPAIWEYLSLDTGKDGGKRDTASLTIFVDEGQLKCCVSDKEAQEVAFWSAETWEELIAGVEADLSVGEGDWRASKKFSKK